MKIHEYYDDSKHEIIEIDGIYYMPVAYGERHRIVVLIKEEIIKDDDNGIVFKNNYQYNKMLAYSTFPEPPKPIGYTETLDEGCKLIRYDK